MTGSHRLGPMERQLRAAAEDSLFNPTTAPPLVKRQVIESVRLILIRISALPWVARRIGPLTIDDLRDDCSLSHLPADFIASSLTSMYAESFIKGAGYSYDRDSRTFTFNP